jgi:hypothetical protein
VINQEQVKEKLLKLHGCTESFSVTFSGKKSVRANGLYDYQTKEITIHNRNFEDVEAGDNRLFYTAMHELAHHIQFSEYHRTGSRSHTKLFYSILDDLADKAETLGLYRYDSDPEIKALTEEAAEISAEIAVLQRRPGVVLDILHDACLKTGVRYEDVVKRKVKLSLQAEKKLKKAAALIVPEGIGYEMQEAVAGAKNEEQRETMLAAAADGGSVDQVKREGAAKKAEPEEENTKALLKEKARIEKSIAYLTKRLENIVGRIKKLGGFG